MKQFNRVISLLLMAVLLVGMLPMIHADAAEDASGTTGNCNWVYNDATKTLTVSPKPDTDGATASYTNTDANTSFPSLRTSVQKVVVADGVTALGSHLFSYFTALTSVTLPQTGLKSLGEGVFRGCTSLTSIVIPDCVESIGRTLFYGCTKLETVVLGGSYTTIPGIVFGACTALKNVTIPASVSAFELSVSQSGNKRGIFYNGAKNFTLTYEGTREQWNTLVANLPNGSDVSLFAGDTVTVQCMDDGTTSGETGNCAWTYYPVIKTLKLSAKEGTNGATGSSSTAGSNTIFSSIASSVETVVVEEGVTALGSHLFVKFTALTSVTLPQSSLKTLGEGVFRGCTALVSATIPASVESIGRTLFWGCSKLETVVLGGSYTSIPGIALGSCPSLKEVTIPSSVRTFEVSVSDGGVNRGIFYNGPATMTIRYGGTKEQWKTLLDGLQANSTDVSQLKSADVTVICSDGTYIYGKENVVSNALGDTVAVQAASGTVSKYFTATIEKGKVYKLTVRWNTAPTMTGSKSEWEIESWTGTTADDTMCETLFQSTKREKAAAGTTTVAAEIIFTAQKDASALVMNIQNLSVDNSVTVDLEEATLAEGVISDAVIDYDANTDMGGNIWDIVLKTGQKYAVEVEWAQTPYHRGLDTGGTGTAWKVQPIIDEDFWGFNEPYYFIAQATGTEPVAVQKKYTGTFTSDGSYTMFNFYAQRVCVANSVHVVVKEDNTPAPTFDVPVDYGTAEKIMDLPTLPSTEGSHSGNYIQGLNIYEDIVFITYDGGYVRTYDLNTGEEYFPEFRMECALESNHCSEAKFSNYKYAEDDPFPLVYVSCDLSTLGCYVERFTYTDETKTAIRSEMVQYLDFSTLRGWKDGEATSEGIHTHSGSMALLETETDTIVYLGRQLTGIGTNGNKCVLAHFDLPACSENGTDGVVYEDGYTIVGESATDTITVDCPVVHFTNDDILDVADAEQDADGYYYWDYYGRYYQGTCIYRGRVLFSHGLNTSYPNYWDDKVFYTGIMNYDYDSDKMNRFLDITGSLNWYGEPQGLLIYEGEMYHILIGRALYKWTINVEGLQGSYDLKCYANIDALKAAIEAAVEADLDPDFCVEDIVLPENFALTGEDQTVVAKVSIYTTWNVQTYEISFNIQAHSFTDYVSNNDATLTTDGTKTADCDYDCGAKDTVTDVGTKLPIEELGEVVSVAAANGTVSKYFNVSIQAGRVYKLTANWAQAPTMTGVKSEWEIESWSALGAAGSRCETLFQATKRESAAANTTTKGFVLTFQATKDAAALVLNVQNLSIANSVVVTLEEASLETDVVADLTVYFAENTDMGSNLFDLAMKDGQKYIVEAQWTNTPYHRGTDNGGTGTAWKFQPVVNEDFWGNNTDYYYSVTATGTTPVPVQQRAVGKFTANSSYTMFNAYAQRVCQANSLHVVIKEDNTPVLPFTTPVDYADTQKVFEFPWIPEMQGATSSNYIQGLEIYNDIVFLVYDGGYVRTYDLNTKAFLQEFRLECALESNHAGGATFSKYKYAEDDPFPLMYVSCDLSTLGCYVERITYDEHGNFQSEMVQYLDFSGLKGWYTAAPTTDGVMTHNGSLVMIEKNSDTIVYLGRQLKSIGDANNQFVMAHFALPACVQGNVAGKIYDGGYTIVGESAADTITVDCPVIHFTNEDILDVANAQQDTDGYYYWDYYGRLYQGSCLFREHVMMSHGVSTGYPNAWGDKTFYTGIMNYAYDSDKMSRFLDITGSNGWTGEPQGLVIYEGRMYHIMTHDGLGVYEVQIRLEDLKDSYDLKCYANIDALKAAIEAAVEADLDPDFCVEDIVLPENFALTGEDQTVVAKVSIYTTWNVQTYEISFTLDAHSYTSYTSNNDATCEADGTKKALCDGGCGTEDTVADSGSKLPHAMTHHAADPSNCTEDGNVEYWHCDTCDKNFADEAGVTELDSTVDPKDGHDMTHFAADPSNCTEDGNVEYWHCDTCDKNFADEAGVTELDSTVDTKDGHDLSKVNKEPATADKDGKEAHWVCDTCGKLFSDEEGKNEVKASDLVIPATGHKVEKAPETGVSIKGLDKVVHGESYTFTVKLEEGYVKGENFKVMVNGKELKANADGSYTVLSVTAKLEISVTGAVKETTIPDTGDHSMIVAAGILAVLTVAMTAVLVSTKKYFF